MYVFVFGLCVGFFRKTSVSVSSYEGHSQTSYDNKFVPKLINSALLSWERSPIFHSSYKVCEFFCFYFKSESFQVLSNVLTSKISPSLLPVFLTCFIFIRLKLKNVCKGVEKVEYLNFFFLSFSLCFIVIFSGKGNFVTKKKLFFGSLEFFGGRPTAEVGSIKKFTHVNDDSSPVVDCKQLSML